MKPSLPKGTRDFLPNDVVKRKYLFGVIEDVFKTFGYVPVETPSMENLSTLTGKYGEEGDKLLFRVLNNGDYLAKADTEALSRRDSQALTPSIAKRGLRYDLTVPFARYVVMHQNDITFPFKRYQIQPVWRADRPQKGRYQEFYQCDADVVGSHSQVYEAELIQIYDAVFARLGLNVIIRMNHRKVLNGIAEVCGLLEYINTLTVAIDKWDKIGKDGVREEFISRGIAEHKAGRILDILSLETLDDVRAAVAASDEGQKGIAELDRINTLLSEIKLTNPWVFSPRLARGLDYYTGCIIEVAASDADIGSLGGGGRYDDLTAVFGLPGISGVGISFGAERIFDVMEQRSMFPPSLHAGPEILVMALSDLAVQRAFRHVSELRMAGISADLYPEPAKLAKQMRYANAVGVRYTAILGDDEIAQSEITVKNMQSGTQQKVAATALVGFITHELVLAGSLPESDTNRNKT